MTSGTMIEIQVFPFSESNTLSSSPGKIASGAAITYYLAGKLLSAKHGSYDVGQCDYVNDQPTLS